MAIWKCTKKIILLKSKSCKTCYALFAIIRLPKHKLNANQSVTVTKIIAFLRVAYKNKFKLCKQCSNRIFSGIVLSHKIRDYVTSLKNNKLQLFFVFV